MLACQQIRRKRTEAEWPSIR